MSIPYLPLFVADYEADTAHLTVAEDGAYMRLLRLQWRTPGCTLPDDDQWIQRRCRAGDDEWRDLFKPILAEFFKRNRGRIFQGRLKAEWERITATSSLRSSAGKKGGRPRKSLKSNEKSESPAKANGKHLEPDLDLDKKTSSSTPISPKGQTRRDECISALSQALPSDVASAMFDHREAMPRKDRLTVKAAELMSGKLAQMAADGLDPVEAANNSIMNGWKGVFPPDKPRHPSPANGADGHDRFAAALRDAERSRDRRSGGPGMDHGAGRKPPRALGALPAEGRAGDDLPHEDGGLARCAGRSSAGGRGDGLREVDPGSEVDAFAEGNPGSGQVLPLLASAGAKW